MDGKAFVSACVGNGIVQYSYTCGVHDLTIDTGGDCVAVGDGKMLLQRCLCDLLICVYFHSGLL